MGSPRYFLSLTGAARERLLQSESTYRSACASREVVRTVERATISDGTFCMTAFIGFDNRALLPPFFPVQRNDDGIWGVTLRRCLEDGYFGFLPWLLLHAPVEARAFAPQAAWKSGVGSPSYDIVIALIESFEFGPGASGGERLRALGKHLTELGTMALADFEEFARIQLWSRAITEISLLEQRLQLYGGAPDFWAGDVKKRLAVLRETLPEEGQIVARDLTAGRSVKEARELMQRLVLKFGRLLAWWPEIVEAAKRLRARGRRLAQPV
jgi:hypothetical protein